MGPFARADPQRVVIVNHPTMLWEALEELLNTLPGICVAAEAEDKEAALQATEQLQPDLVIVDPSVPEFDSLELIRAIKQRTPQTRIIVLADSDALETVAAYFREGVNGYILKSASQNEFVLSITSVLQGKTYVSVDLHQQLCPCLVNMLSSYTNNAHISNLTTREYEVLKLVAEGKRSKQIAFFLHISIKTVEKHRANLMRKLDIHSATALTGFAIKLGLLSPDEHTAIGPSIPKQATGLVTRGEQPGSSNGLWASRSISAFIGLWWSIEALL